MQFLRRYFIIYNVDNCVKNIVSMVGFLWIGTSNVYYGCAGIENGRTIIATYNIDDLKVSKQNIMVGVYTKYIAKILVYRGNDCKETIAADSINNDTLEKHTFSETGEYKIYFQFKPELKAVAAMFHKCSCLVEADFSHFDSSNIVSTQLLFCGAVGLTKVNFGKFVAKNVTDMSNMFKDCGKLTSLDLSSFDTNNVKNMAYMFSGCKSLTEIDLTKFSFTNVEKMSGMFENCTVLQGFRLPDSLTNSKNIVADCLENMFKNCHKLWNADKVLNSFDDVKAVLEGNRRNNKSRWINGCCCTCW